MEQHQNKNETTGIPDNDPSKAMDSKREVEASPDPKTDQDLPGYPHYPAREDILHQDNEYTREDVGVENLPTSENDTGVGQRFVTDSNQDLAKESKTPLTATDDSTDASAPNT